eukprot:CAMPEP_0194275546 /NCGR_PEP_ID=MMETSP0169-20130528/8360_1 /TAXON_ID=218684 /ORGANISM="Corethron pennatum, Strain L29A3" /LENGTH=71 /DNA_ID=CAMNT_0039019031 /DNA_START=118 /DNA_END=329 /DNA_ORIENTATION=+
MTNDYFEDSSSPGDNHKLDSAREINIGSNAAPQSNQFNMSNFVFCSRSEKRTVSTDSEVAAERSNHANKSS